MTKDINELIRRQQARILAESTLERAAGQQRLVGGGTYLVTSFKQRDDLPITASLRKMSENVVSNLAQLGLHEPVSLRILPGRWWKAHVDAAEVDVVREYGCGYVTRILSSEQLSSMGFEVVDGPFKAWANMEVSRAILKESAGKYWDARISNRPLLPRVEGVDTITVYDNAYTSEALLAALDAGQAVTVFSGPYDKEEDAHYSLDVRWEAPE